MKEKLAIIGTGIAGLSSAYFLKEKYDITLFEKNNYIGGHTNTIDETDGQKLCAFDTGFMVFNETTYPLLTALFKKLDIKYVDTDMSFSVWNESINLEYNGSNIDGLFSQRRNILNYSFVKMIFEITKFNKESTEQLLSNQIGEISIRDFVNSIGLSQYFLNNFLVPMGSAVWSTPVDKMLDFPAKSLIRFFHNHGFTGVDTQLQWKTVKGGSRSYRNKIISEFENKIQISNPAISVENINNKIHIQTKNGLEIFDKVIMASHADESLSLLKKPTSRQSELLSAFKYQANTAVIHTDTSVMPKLRKNWSAWNYAIRGNDIYTTYYMNKLQDVSEFENFFVNINGENFIDPKKIRRKIEYHHPLFDLSAQNAQEHLQDLNEFHNNIYFCGSYFRHGFHEDALFSSVELCKKILKKDFIL